MDFDMPAEDDPRRTEIRAWLADNPSPTNRELAEAGYVAPHWPRPYGREADGMTQLIIAEELATAGVSGPVNPIGIGWAGPTILEAGTSEQKSRYLPPLLTGEEFWCQLFSEPDAGSDLASLGTRAERDGDTYVVNGSKIWSSGAHHAQYGILIARTNPDLPKHKGISYFICPMDADGLSMTPIVDMTQAHSFNQVFFDDVKLHESLRIGEEGDGWRLAKVTLANERISLSSAGSLWGAGPTPDQLIGLMRGDGTHQMDPVTRQEVTQLHIEAELLRLNRLRTLSARLAGKTPGAEASIQKVMADELGQKVMELAKQYVGTEGMLVGSGPPGEIPAAQSKGSTEIRCVSDHFDDVHPIWHYGFAFSPALTLGGGTFAVQRNIVAEMVLGLPREINVERNMTWAETRRNPRATDARSEQSP